VEAFLVSTGVVALGEMGDKTQLLAMLLGARFRAPAAVLAGIAAAAGVNMAIAGAAGMEIAALIPHRAVQLMTGVALLLAASGAALRVKPSPSVDRWTLGPFASSLGAFLILALGDKTQFLTTAIAAGSGHPVLAAAGAAAGVTLANAPAVVLGERWPKLVPLKAIRIGAGIALALAGAVLVIAALGLS